MLDLRSTKTHCSRIVSLCCLLFVFGILTEEVVDEKTGMERVLLCGTLLVWKLFADACKRAGQS